jgi:hypothetical protein
LRPRKSTEGAALGALIGAMASGGAGLLIGGLLGGAVGGSAATPLEAAIRADLASVGLELVTLHRHGRYRVEVLFRRGSDYWTLESRAPRSLVGEELDDWLYGDFVDVQLRPWLAARRFALR